MSAVHPSPWYFDPDILTVCDANGDTVVSAEIGPFPRMHKAQVQVLRRIVAAVNFTRFMSIEGLEERADDALGIALTLSFTEPGEFTPRPVPKNVVPFSLEAVRGLKKGDS